MDWKISILCENTVAGRLEAAPAKVKILTVRSIHQEPFEASHQQRIQGIR